MNQTTLPLVALVIAATLSVVSTTDKHLTLYEIVALVKCLILYLVIANSIRDERDARFVMYSLVAGFALASALYIAQSILHVDFSMVGQVKHLAGSESLGGNIRPRGTLGHPNAAGGYLAGMLIVSLVALAFKQTLVEQALLFCAAALGAWALVMTFTRTGWVAFACGLPVMLAVGVKKKVLGMGSVFVLLCGTLVVGLVFGSLIIARFTTNLETYYSRIPLVKQAFYMISKHPITGCGANTYMNVVRNYIPPDMDGFWEYSVHNGYLYHWVELGTIGLFAFLWLLCSMGHEAWKTLRSRDCITRTIGLCAISFLAVECVFMNGVQWYLYTPSGLSFCVILAVVAMLSDRQTPSRNCSAAVLLSNKHEDAAQRCTRTITHGGYL